MKCIGAIGDLYFPFLLSSLDMVVFIRMKGAVNNARIVADMLHNIYFAAHWPSAILPVCREHPDSGPCSSAHGEFGFYFYSAVLPVAFIFCDQPCAGEPFSAH